jgi:hypothetical protein
LSITLRHVGIVINDVEIWLAFLETTLGFKISIDQVEKGEFISQLIGVPNTTVRTIKLSDSGGGVIELLKFQNQPNSIENKKNLTPLSFGITHIALRVESIDCLVKNLNEKGLNPISEPRISNDGKAKVCYLRGPEKVFFELVEIIS